MFALKKGDLVAVLTGKDRGKKGKVLKVLPKENRVLVEGVNFLKAFSRPTQQNPKGGILSVEGKLHRSNVRLICPKCSKPTRAGFEFLADKTKHRICRKCKEII